MKYLIGIGISVALLAVFVFTVDVRRMLEALSGANYWFTIPAVGMYLLSVYFRSLRWTVMLRHLKPVSTMRLYPVVTIGYMVNNLLPMRVGELVRSYYVGEREGINKAAALVTVLVERVFDALTLLFFVAVVALFVPVSGIVESFGERFGVPETVIVLGFSLPFVMVARLRYAGVAGAVPGASPSACSVCSASSACPMAAEVDGRLAHRYVVAGAGAST